MPNGQERNILITMEKKALVLLSLGLVFGLASCGGENLTSSSVSTESAASESSSEAGGTASSDSSSSSSTELSYDWPEEERTILSENLFGNVPPRIDAFDGENFEIDNQMEDYGYLDLIVSSGAYSLVGEYAAVLEQAGYVDNTDSYEEVETGMRILDGTFADNVHIQVQLYVLSIEAMIQNQLVYISEGTGIFYATFFPEQDIVDFPSELVTAAAEEHFGVAGFELPPFEAEQYKFFEPDFTYPFIEIDGYGASDITDEYNASLLAAGFEPVSLDGATFYLDESGSLIVYGAYDAEYGIFYVTIQEAPSFEWPEAELEAALAEAGLEGVNIPVLAGGDYYEVDPSYAIVGYLFVYAYGVDGSEIYDTALKNAGYTLGEDGYLDPTGAALVTFFYNEDYDYTSISIQTAPAAPTSAFPTEEIASLLAGVGYDNVVIPAPEGTFSQYVVDDDWMTVFSTIYVECYTENANAAEEYVAQIAEDGWALAGNVYLNDAYAGIAISARYDSDFGYLEIMVIYGLE